MTLTIYNTLSRKKEPFEPLEPGKVRMYVCGPTVYDKAHVGHAMSSIVFDVIRRYLEHKSYEVCHVMNYTDVDDKVIRRAQELGVDSLELAMGYIEEYDRHLGELNVLPAEVKPKVSEEIKPIIDMVKGLINKGYAYEVEGDVFFEVARDEDYGKLSGRQIEDMQAGARLEVDERKRNPADFALWKSAKPGEPAWDSPWGKGRPGWHIECSAMSLHHLGERIDIHGGGNDLIFPHHENEIAQTESFTGKSFAKYWVHNGMMQLAGQDMSKSTGNVYTIERFLAEHEGDVLRLLVLRSNYRSPLTFNQEVILQAKRSLERLRGALRPAYEKGQGTEAEASQLQEALQRAQEGFERAMDDDFNTAGALGHLFELVRAIHQSREAGVGAEELSAAQAELIRMAGILGLELPDQVKAGSDADPFIHLLIELRNELRQEKQYELADRIRDQLAERGVQLEDTPGGTDWHWE